MNSIRQTKRFIFLFELPAFVKAAKHFRKKCLRQYYFMNHMVGRYLGMPITSSIGQPTLDSRPNVPTRRVVSV